MLAREVRVCLSPIRLRMTTWAGLTRPAALFETRIRQLCRKMWEVTKLLFRRTYYGKCGFRFFDRNPADKSVRSLKFGYSDWRVFPLGLEEIGDG